MPESGAPIMMAFTSAQIAVRHTCDEIRARYPTDPVLDRQVTLIEVLTEPYLLPRASVEWDALKLTKYQRRVLELLSSRPEHIFTYDAIMNAVYYDHSGDEPNAKILSIFVYKIRQELVAKDAAVWVENCCGQGYRRVERNAREAYAELPLQGARRMVGNQNARKAA